MLAKEFGIQPSEADNLPVSALYVAMEMMQDIEKELKMQEAMMFARGRV